MIVSHFCPNLQTASQLTENKSHILARSPRPLPLDSWPPLTAPDTSSSYSSPGSQTLAPGLYLLPLPGKFPRIILGLAPSLTSYLCLKGTFSVRPSLPALFSITLQPFQTHSMFLFYQSLPPSVYFIYLSCLLFICTQK